MTYSREELINILISNGYPAENKYLICNWFDYKKSYLFFRSDITGFFRMDKQ